MTIQSSVSPVVKAYLIQSALVSRNGGPWKQRTSITAHPGDQLRFKVRLKVWKGATSDDDRGPHRARDRVRLRLPDRRRGGLRCRIRVRFRSVSVPHDLQAHCCSPSVTRPSGDDLQLTLDLHRLRPRRSQGQPGRSTWTRWSTAASSSPSTSTEPAAATAHGRLVAGRLGRHLRPAIEVSWGPSRASGHGLGMEPDRRQERQEQAPVEA